MKEYKFLAQRAICPGCGTALTLDAEMALVTCDYCGTDSKIVRKLRKIEPELPIQDPPRNIGDPSKNYSYWTGDQLVCGIINTSDLQERLKMAKALDSWSNVNCKTADLIPVIVRIMLESEPELDIALSGILGKLICSDDVKLKLKVIEAGKQFGFIDNGSKGLLFALSLGNAGTVKLLLDIAQWAADRGLNEYAQSALIGVQTAIGRDAKRLKVCMETLLCRLPYASAFVRQWIMKFLKNHFDVGYTFLFVPVIEIIDDEIKAKSHEVPSLVKAFKLCRRAKERREYIDRLNVFKILITKEAKNLALQYMGEPPKDINDEDVKLAAGVFEDLLLDKDFQKNAGNALSKLILHYKENKKEIPLPLKVLIKKHRDILPSRLIDQYFLS